MSDATANGNLLVCCNILTRVETLLEMGTRIQISKENLESIGEYLTKAVKFIDSNIDLFTSQLIVFGTSIESIDSLVKDKQFVATNFDTKVYLVDKLYPTIIEFKVNVGKYLSEREFKYSPAMDTVIKNIIDVCLENGYYFGY
jgi:hypothetical protein